MSLRTGITRYGWIALALFAFMLQAPRTAPAAILEDEEGLLFGESEPAAGEEEEAFIQPVFNAMTNLPGIGVEEVIAEAPPLQQQRELARQRQSQDQRAAAREWRVLGDMLVASNRMDEAARAYWQASRINPANLGYLHYFGFSLLALGDHENGRRVYLEILDRYPDARKVLFNLASASYGLGRYEQALQYLQAYLDTRPRENPKALLNAGLIYLALDRPEEAIPMLERARERLPTSPFIPAALVRAYRAAGKNDAADHTQGLSEDRFGAAFFRQLLATEIPPVFLDR